MCCCEKPTINGQPGCKMTFEEKTPSVYDPAPPPLEEGDTLVFDEPGRCCSGSDSHAYHYRLVEHCGHELLYQHGGGNGRIRLSTTRSLLESLTALDSNARYWIFNAIFHAQNHAARDARDSEAARWMHAAANKRIKTRKYPARGTVKVWIELAPLPPGSGLCFSS